jgi:rfaE bifunctional protein kinase chain/domain
MERVALSRAELDHALAAIGKVRVGLVGDVCLDAYWDADMRRSALSRETPHHPLPVVGERYSPGGAGNVAACVAALRPAALIPVSLIGDDWRAFLLRRCFEERGIDTTRLIESRSRVTPAYCKPIRHGISQVAYEDPRLDFENTQSPDEEDEARVIEALDNLASEVDILIASDQFACGVITAAVREKLAALGKRGMKLVVDSRERIASFRHAILKPNELEAAAALGAALPDEVTAESYRGIAARLSERTGMPAIVTLGAAGALWASEGNACYAPAKPAQPPVDIVGAGDAFLAAFACAYGAGIDGGRAIAFANLAAAVTVKKLGTTGVASPAEIIEKYGEVTA